MSATTLPDEGNPMTATSDLLRELHRIHRQLADLSERLEAGPRKIKAGTVMVSQKETAQTEAADGLKAARIAVDQKQLELKTGEGKIEDHRVKLNTASNNREYQSFLEQIAAAEMANSVLEDEILEALEKIEQLQVGLGQAKEDVEKSKADLAKTEQVVAEETGKLNAEVDRLKGELAAGEGQLPADFRSEYDRIVRGKGEEAMASIDGDNCGGCFQQVTPNMMNELGLGRVVMCRACGRLLYPAE